MRVELETEGGFAYVPGLAGPFSVDGDELPEAESRSLAELVERADVFGRADARAPAPGSADHRTYRLTVDDGGRRRTITVSDPVEDAALQRLIDFVRSRAGPPGASA